MIRFSFSPDVETVKRQLVESLLDTLQRCLEINLAAYLASIQAGNYPESVFSNLGYMLAERLRQQEDQITQLESERFLNEGRISWLSKEIQRISEEPVRQQLEQTQEQVSALTRRLNQAESDLTAVRRALGAEQRSRQQETARRDEYIAAQNRIIAQQQLRLNGLLGETPGAETPGER